MTKKRKAKRVRCKYRKGDHIIHAKLGEYVVTRTQKVNVTYAKFHVHLQSIHGGREIVMADNDRSIRKV